MPSSHRWHRSAPPMLAQQCQKASCRCCVADDNTTATAAERARDQYFSRAQTVHRVQAPVSSASLKGPTNKRATLEDQQMIRSARCPAAHSNCSQRCLSRSDVMRVVSVSHLFTVPGAPAGLGSGQGPGKQPMHKHWPIQLLLVMMCTLGAAGAQPRCCSGQQMRPLLEAASSMRPGGACPLAAGCWYLSFVLASLSWRL